jgi:hypothetical protein
MMRDAEQDQKSCHRVQRLPWEPVMSSYTTAPRKLPIDFYELRWCKELSPALQETIPNTENMVFLPNASKSLLPKGQRHPDESASDKTFTLLYYKTLAEPYGLVGSPTSEDEDSGDDQKEEYGSKGEGIDLDGPSPDASEDEGFYEEGDAGDLYEDSDDGEEGSVNGDDDKDSGDKNYDGEDDQGEDYQDKNYNEEFNEAYDGGDDHEYHAAAGSSHSVTNWMEGIEGTDQVW